MENFVEVDYGSRVGAWHNACFFLSVCRGDEAEARRMLAFVFPGTTDAFVDLTKEKVYERVVRYCFQRRFRIVAHKHPSLLCEEIPNRSHPEYQFFEDTRRVVERNGCHFLGLYVRPSHVTVGGGSRVSAPETRPWGSHASAPETRPWGSHASWRPVSGRHDAPLAWRIADQAERDAAAARRIADQVERDAALARTLMDKMERDAAAARRITDQVERDAALARRIADQAGRDAATTRRLVGGEELEDLFGALSLNSGGLTSREAQVQSDAALARRLASEGRDAALAKQLQEEEDRRARGLESDLLLARRLQEEEDRRVRRVPLAGV